MFLVGRRSHTYTTLVQCASPVLSFRSFENQTRTFCRVSGWVRSLLTFGLWRRLNNRWHGIGMKRYGARCRPHACMVTALWSNQTRFSISKVARRKAMYCYPAGHPQIFSVGAMGDQPLGWVRESPPVFARMRCSAQHMICAAQRLEVHLK